MIEMIAKTMTVGVNHFAASGKSGRQSRIIQNVPTLSSTPTSSTEVAGVASAAASGSQVCTGTIGALREGDEEAEEHPARGVGARMQVADQVGQEEALVAA